MTSDKFGANILRLLIPNIFAIFNKYLYLLIQIPQISPKSSPSWSPERHTPEPREATPPTDDKLRHKPWITENILGKIIFTTQKLVVRSNFKLSSKLILEKKFLKPNF